MQPSRAVEQFVYCLMLRSEVAGTGQRGQRGVTKTFRLSPVPVSGPDILQVHHSHKAIWCWEHSTQKYSFYRHLWSFVIAFLYSNSPTSWLRSIIVKPKMVGQLDQLDPSYLPNWLMLIWQDERSDCQGVSLYNTLLYILDSLKLTSTQIREWRCWTRWGDTITSLRTLNTKSTLDWSPQTIRQSLTHKKGLFSLW